MTGLKWQEENEEDRQQEKAERIGFEISDESDERTDETSSSSTSSSSEKYSEDVEKRMTKHRKDMLHRDIEKKRRDRINKSLAQLKDLIPSAKNELKCVGTSKRSGRLQKAKLLELAVDYLKDMKSKDIDVAPKNVTEDQKKNIVIVDSAKEIYVSGYKAGANGILEEINRKFKLTQQQYTDLNMFVVSSEFSIPDIKFVPPGIDKPTTGEVNNGIHRYEHEQFTVPNNLNDNDRPPYLMHPKETYDNFEAPKKVDCKTETNAFLDDKIFPSDIDKHANPLLLSMYVLDPLSGQYRATVMPLSILMNSNGLSDSNPTSTLEHYYKLRHVSEGFTGEVNPIKRKYSTETPVIRNTDKRIKSTDAPIHPSYINFNGQNRIY